MGCSDIKVLVKRYKREKGEIKRLVLKRMSEVEKGTPVYKMLYQRIYHSDELFSTDKCSTR